MTSNLNIDSERVAFEAKYGPKDNFSWLNTDGSYKIASLQQAWEIWLASASHRRTPAAESGELAKLREDAGRYRLLVEKFGITKLPCFLEAHLFYGYIADGKDAIDMAIDAQRAALPHSMGKAAGE